MNVIAVVEVRDAWECFIMLRLPANVLFDD
jgi:hypothetical protein